MKANVQKVITLDHDEMLAFCGNADNKIKAMQGQLKARIVARGDQLRLSGEPQDVERAYSLIKELLTVQRSGKTPLTARQVELACQHNESHGEGSVQEVFLDTIPIALKRKHVAPLTPTQKTYIDSIRRHDIVFGIGPAGTGKTYLAVAMAVARLVAGEVSRVILVRPAVEAGEKLGFLPGDLAEKLNPYMRPLYDALYEMLEVERMQKYLTDGTIEIAPLAFMRGRTLNNSFIILDEAQNTTPEQMKMFLTRLGLDSVAVVTGDLTQMDLPQGKPSGLAHVRKILHGIRGIDFVEFGGQDVVRHSLVQRIIQAYDEKAEAPPNPSI